MTDPFPSSVTPTEVLGPGDLVIPSTGNRDGPTAQVQRPVIFTGPVTIVHHLAVVQPAVPAVVPAPLPAVPLPLRPPTPVPLPPSVPFPTRRRTGAGWSDISAVVPLVIGGGLLLTVWVLVDQLAMLFLVLAVAAGIVAALAALLGTLSWLGSKGCPGLHCFGCKG